MRASNGVNPDAIRSGITISSLGTPIDAKYSLLGGSTGFLGAPLAVEAAALGGRYRNYVGGSIYWSAPTAAREVRGSILGRWTGLSRERGVLGFPTTDQLVTPNGIGRVNHFQGGSIFWTARTGAHEVRGAIRDRWAGTGWENGVLGFPTTDELRTPNGLGLVNHFQGGSIFWTPGTGAHEVRGPIRDRWAGTGWENGVLGFPTSNELRTPNGLGLVNHFQRGSIFWTPGTGAHEVRGPIRDRWAGTGWENGVLGFPTSNEYAVPGGRRNDFQGGAVLWNTTTGATGAFLR